MVGRDVLRPAWVSPKTEMKRFLFLIFPVLPYYMMPSFF
jgi:hypothetical protein